MSRERSMAVTALHRSLTLTGGIVSLEVAGRQVRLAKLVRGERLDDEDCDTGIQALETGIFRRYETQKDGVPGLRWMRVCGTSRDDVDLFLEHLAGAHDLSPADLSGIAASAAFRSVMLDESRGPGL